MAYAIIGVAKLKGSAISSSDSHSDRTRETPNADEELLDKNIYLRGGKTPLRDLLDENFKTFGGKQRKDAVECLEFLCTASPEFFFSEEDKVEEKTNRFVEKIEEFIKVLDKKGITVVKALVHFDETTPHAPIYGVPRDETGTLNSKYHTGTRTKMANFHDEYARVMKPLGLKRGRRRSHATHQDVKQFYNTIISQAEVEIAAQTIPDPPALMRNFVHLEEYKQQVIESVKAEIVPQITRIRNQAMLTNHYKGFKEAAEERAARLENELKTKEAELKLKDDKLAESHSKLQKFEAVKRNFAKTKEPLTVFEIKHSDLPLIEISRIFASQIGTPSKTGEAYFSDGAGRLSFYVEGNRAFDLSGETYAETSIELSQKILKEQGRSGNIPEVIAGLAGHFTDEEITAAVSCYAYQKAHVNLREAAVGGDVETVDGKAAGKTFISIQRESANEEWVEVKTDSLSGEVLQTDNVDDDEELFEVLNRVLPAEKVKTVSSPSLLIAETPSDERENQNDTATNEIFTEKKQSYKEAGKIDSKQRPDTNPAQKILDKSAEGTEKSENLKDPIETKSVANKTAEPKSVSRADTNTDTSPSEQKNDSTVISEINKSERINAILRQRLFGNSEKTDESSEISESSKTSEILNQSVAIPDLTEEPLVKESVRSVPVKNEQLEIDDKKQSKELALKENASPELKAGNEAVKNEVIIETVSEQKFQPSSAEEPQHATISESLEDKVTADALSEKPNNSEETQNREATVAGLNISASKLAGEEKSDSGIEPVYQSDVEKNLSRQLGIELVAEIELRKSQYDAARFVRNINDERLKITADIGKGIQLRTISRADLLRERSAIAQNSVASAKQSGILGMIADDEGKTIEVVEKAQYVKELKKAGLMQKLWADALDKAITEETARVEEKTENASAALEKEQSATKAVAEKIGIKNIEVIKPTLPPEKVWLEQIEAVKRGDAEIFIRLEEINRAAGASRPKDAYERLRAMEAVASVNARRENHDLAEWVGQTEAGKERIIINVRAEQGVLKIENWRVKKIDQTGEQLTGQIREENKIAADKIAVVNEAALRPLINKINPFQNQRGAAWLTQPKEMLNAHLNPIEIIRNDSAVQVVRAVAVYIESKGKEKEFNKIADSVIREAKILRQQLAPETSGNNADRLTDAVKTAIQSEEILRENLKVDSSATAALLETPQRAFTDAELKQIDSIAIETGDAKEALEYLDLVSKDAVFAEAAAETKETVNSKSLLSEARAAWEARQSIECIKTFSDGSVDVEINPAQFNRALDVIEMANVFEAFQSPAAQKSIISYLSLEEAEQVRKLLGGNNQLAEPLNNQINNLGFDLMRNLEPPLTAAEQRIFKEMAFTQETQARFDSIARSEQFLDRMAQQSESLAANEMTFQMQAHNLTITNPSDKYEAEQSKFWENDRLQREAKIAEERAAKRLTMTESERAQADAADLEEAEAFKAEQSEDMAEGRTLIL